MSKDASNIVNEINAKIKKMGRNSHHNTANIATQEAVDGTKGKSWWMSVKSYTSDLSMRRIAESSLACAVLVFVLVFLTLSVIRPPFVYTSVSHERQQLSWVRIFIIAVVTAIITFFICRYLA